MSDNAAVSVCVIVITVVLALLLLRGMEGSDQLQNSHNEKVIECIKAGDYSPAECEAVIR